MRINRGQNIIIIIICLFSVTQQYMGTIENKSEKVHSNTVYDGGGRSHHGDS
jgi:hypothetical protein